MTTPTQKIEAFLKEIEELEAKAMGGNWYWMNNRCILGERTRAVIVGDMEECDTKTGLLKKLDARGPNAQLIAHLRNNCKTLTGIIRELVEGCEASQDRTGCLCGRPLCPDCAHDQGLSKWPKRALERAADLIKEKV